MKKAVIYSGIPEELPVGSVVLGKSGVAWQSYAFKNPYGEGAAWGRYRPEDAGFNGHGGQKWGYLVIEEAPLTVLYVPGEDKDSDA
jgi:hypothetical protein